MPLNPKLSPLEVREVRRETVNSVEVELSIPAGLEDAFTFVPGQYLTLEAEIDGERVRRPYSICSGRGEPLRVGIKRVPGGRFSTFANEHLKEGAKVFGLPPAGRFSWQTSPKPIHHVAFAAGSGITPILSIAKSVLSECPQDRFTLIYGNRTPASAMFLEALHDLKDRHLERLRIFHVFSRASSDVELFEGRIDEEKVRGFVRSGHLRTGDLDVAYVCGPGTMIDSVRAGLVAEGVDVARVHAEHFASNSPAPTAPRPAETKRAIQVETILEGARQSFSMDAEENVLDAASRAGVDLPFSCAKGMCCTCRCRLLEGRADMRQNYSLEGWEMEAGFVLACQLKPETDRVILDFDAR